MSAADVLVLAATLATSGVCSTLAVLYHLGVAARQFEAAQGWLDARHRAAAYHRHCCHAHPTRLHRARRAVRRVLSLRLRATTPAQTTTTPDIHVRTAH